MKNIAAALALALLTAPAFTAEPPDWAYPITPKPEPKDNLVLKQMPGSSRQYTQAQIDDGFLRTGFPTSIRRCRRSSLMAPSR